MLRIHPVEHPFVEDAGPWLGWQPVDDVDGGVDRLKTNPIPAGPLEDFHHLFPPLVVFASAPRILDPAVLGPDDDHAGIWIVPPLLDSVIRPGGTDGFEIFLP